MGGLGNGFGSFLAQVEMGHVPDWVNPQTFFVQIYKNLIYLDNVLVMITKTITIQL